MGFDFYFLNRLTISPQSSFSENCGKNLLPRYRYCSNRNVIIGRYQSYDRIITLRMSGYRGVVDSHPFFKEETVYDATRTMFVTVFENRISDAFSIYIMLTR